MENLTGGTPPVRYLLCVVPCKLYFASFDAISRIIWSTFQNVFCKIEDINQNIETLVYRFGAVFFFHEIYVLLEVER